MKRRSKIIICVMIVAVVIINIFAIRKANYDTGNAQGYLSGYTMGIQMPFTE